MAIQAVEPKKNIYFLVGEAMRKIQAVGKNSVNETQGFKYRGIDAVMNALNPVMSELGLFIVPEVINQEREERETFKNVSYWEDGTKKYKEVKSLLKYSILTIKYTLYAPDGSNVSCVVIGEGMDGGDKASNKAMAVGLKYACFQIFMIPTEDMAQDDPDKESFEVTSAAMQPAKPAPAKKANATVEKQKQLPTGNPVRDYLAKELEALRVVREVSSPENIVIWKAQIKALTDAGMIPKKPVSEFTMDEAKHMVECMYANFEPKGMVLKNEGPSA